MTLVLLVGCRCLNQQSEKVAMTDLQVRVTGQVLHSVNETLFGQFLEPPVSKPCLSGQCYAPSMGTRPNVHNKHRAPATFETGQIQRLERPREHWRQPFRILYLDNALGITGCRLRERASCTDEW
jgi:hypothetical protein